MAVYTDVSAEDLGRFLAGYDLGELLSYKGIAEGVENSNFLVHTGTGHYILTLYEKRVAAGDLPFFLALMEHLAARGITCPQPVKDRSGNALGTLCGRPAAVVTFLDGMWMRRPDAGHCAAVGEALARMHLAGADFSRQAAQRALGRRLAAAVRAAAARADGVQHGLRATIETELGQLEKAWPRDLPQGVIHADLFPDNVFFLGDRLSGLIDFYFACTDTLAYDVAICLNAWCFEPDHSYNVTKGRNLLDAYIKTRPLSDAEREALPLLARGAALRFLLTRLVDWLNVPRRRAGAAEGPARIFPQAALPPEGRERARLRPAGRQERARDRRPARHRPHRRRLLGQSRSGRLGRDPDLRRAREGAKGGEAAHHQQPHGADGGDRGAGGAEEALARSSCTPTASMCRTASRNGSTAGSATAGRPPTRSR